MPCALIDGTYGYAAIARFADNEAMRVAEAIELDAQTERELRKLSKGRRVEARVQQRASVILLAAQGWQNTDIAEAVKLDRRQVAMWRRRFIDGGVQALLQDAVRSGRTPSVTQSVESLIVSRTLREQPAEAAHWSTRTLASDLGLSATTIRRVWQRNGIQPHLQDAPSSSQRRSTSQPIDVVGLYLNPPERALVLTGLPTKPGRVSTTSRDPQRSGLAILFAALNLLNGARTSVFQARYHHEAWMKFLRLIDRKTPRHQPLHLIAESGATHEHPEVLAWLARHPRFVMHFAPSSASWLKTVTRFLSAIPEEQIGRDSLTDMAGLLQAMAQYLENRHEHPKPFIWTVSAADEARGITQAATPRTKR